MNGIDKKHDKNSLETRSPNIVIKETAQKNDEHGKPVIYLVNYTADGKERFAILSADKREVPILAYGPNFQNFYAIPAGPAEWIQDRFSRIKEIRKENKPDQDIEVKKAWTNLALLPAGVLPPPPPPPGCGTYTTTIVGPLTSTIWDQNCNNFNYFVNKGTCTQSLACGKKSLGCVAVAIGQIAKKWNFGSLPGKHAYDFTDMPYNLGNWINPYSNSKMLYEISEDVYTQYYCLVSGTTAVAAEQTFHHLGYTSAIKCLWNGASSIMIGQISNGWPVFCSGSLSQTGGGHAWVIDGFTQSGDECYTYTPYYRCNWGWRGDWNGNYRFGEFNVNGGVYNYQNDIIINIFH